MPILKLIEPARSQPAAYHTFTSVEFVRKPGGLHWRGFYRSFSGSGGAGPALATGTIEGVPLTDFSVDPIEALERACIAHPDNVFFGGEYAAPGDVSGGLEVERILAWQRVKGARDAYLNAGVDTPFGRFDSDLNTLVNLLGAVAEMPEGGSQGWILADHTPVILAKPQLQALGAALKTLRDSSYAQGSALYAQIQAAQTAEAVRAISWTPPA